MADETSCAGGERGESTTGKTRAWIPNQTFSDGSGIHIVPWVDTPLLVGLVMIRIYGLVLDYHHDTVYSHRLKRIIPLKASPSGHLAVFMLPGEEDYAR